MKSKLRIPVICSVLSIAISSFAGPGALDTTFYATVSGGPVYSMAIQPDSRILIAGNFTSVNATPRNRIARLFPDGSLDSAFLTNTLSGAGATIWTMVLQPDGRILVGGDFTYINNGGRNRIARLNTDGSVDTTFNASGANSTVSCMALQSDGKVLVGGSFNYGVYPQTVRNYLVRLNADGTVDTNFNSTLSLNAPVYALALQPDGKILVGGTFTTPGYGLNRNSFLRLEADGTPDVTFPNATANYGASSGVYAILVQDDGRILLGGNFTSINGTNATRIGRISSTGSMEPLFDTTTAYSTYEGGANSAVLCLAIQSNSDILAGGAFSTYNNTSRGRFVRTFPDGTLDTTFLNGQPGANNNVRCLVAQSDGKILVGGEFTSFNGTNRAYLVRVDGDLYPPEILTQPQNKSTNIGASVTFTVEVNNPTPVTYQWRKNGADISGATLNSFSLFNVQRADSASYSVFLTDGAGAITSSNAVLAVGIPPTITGQPVSTTSFVGQSASFSAAVEGDAPIRLLWLYNGSPIAGETNSTLILTNLQTTSAGTYALSATNAFGGAVSSNAFLTVIAPSASPTLINQTPTIQIVGPPGANCVVEVATNLTPPTTWQPIATNSIGNDGTWNFVDTNNLASPETHYRLTTF